MNNQRRPGSGNIADRGGAIFNRGALTVDSSTLSGNQAQDAAEGGAIFNSGTLTVSNSTFSGNGVGDGSGGAINSGYLGGGTVTVTNSTFSGNGASYYGGAIAIFAGSLKLSASTISVNRAGEYGSRDSVIFLGGETATISNSTVSGNTTHGGGTIVCYGTVSISDSTISGNAGSGLPESAGGILNSGSLTVSNSTISGNTGSSGLNSAGGIFNHGTLTLSNSTVSGNTGWVGGIANFPVSKFELRNSIISGDGSTPNFFGSFVSQGHNLSSDNGSGFLTGPGDLINANPLFAPLQDNGGPTFTMALLPGSPAIDAGDNTDAPEFDQRGSGFPRIVGGTIDIGAFEVQPGLATRFQVSAPVQVTSNTPFDVTVTALDAYGHTAVGYLGTVTFGSADSDPGVLLPADYTFTADDQGVHAFVGAFVLITVGDQTLTATDTADQTITGSASVAVIPGPTPPPGGSANGPGNPTVVTESTPVRLFGSPSGREPEFLLARHKTNAAADDLFRELAELVV